MARRIGEIGVPTRYFDEASSVGFRRSVVYGLSTLRVVARYVLHRLARAPIAEARRATPGRLTPMARVSRRSLLRGASSAIAISVISIWHPHPMPSTSGPPSRSCATASPAWIAVMVVTAFIDVAARGARWRALLAPIAPLPYRRVLGYTYIGYLANNVLPARLGELYRSHALGEGEGVSRTTVLGTVVVERVVDTVMVVAIAAARGPRPERPGRDVQRGPAGRRVRGPAGHRPRPRDRRPPTARRGTGRAA